ncbi:hypothetical protein PUN28_002176 [Cardiocondyla obscurior]|uniref:Uncharacterized protein n=1 Tax=Cardiocondyla obscurior TaxID=286306 RepID=A0AAW2GSS3_9HYME
MSTLRKKNMYNIINFIKWDNNTSIDCVPSTWILFDGEQQELVCQYMPPPYSAKKYKVLQELIKSKSSPIQKWSQYPIRILASISTKYFFNIFNVDSTSDNELYNASKNKIKLVEKSSTTSKQINKSVIIDIIKKKKKEAVCGLNGVVTYVHSSSKDSGKIKLNLLI